jgi:hypothetical protein
MQGVSTGFGDEGDDAAACLAELSFEAIGIDGKLGDGFDGRREVGGFPCVARAVA